jgi:hypothetical protein
MLCVLWAFIRHQVVGRGFRFMDDLMIYDLALFNAAFSTHDGLREPSQCADF